MPTLFEYDSAFDRNIGWVTADEQLRLRSARVASLLALQKQLVELRHRCASERGVDECGILQRLTSTGGVSALPDDGHTHVGKSHHH